MEIEVECDKQPVENILFTKLERNLAVLYETKYKLQWDWKGKKKSHFMENMYTTSCVNI